MVEQDLVLEMAEKAQEHQDVHVYPRGWEGQDHHPQLAQDQDQPPLEVDQDLNQRPLLVADQDQAPLLPHPVAQPSPTLGELLKR